MKYILYFMMMIYGSLCHAVPSKFTGPFFVQFNSTHFP